MFEIRDRKFSDFFSIFCHDLNSLKLLNGKTCKKISQENSTITKLKKSTFFVKSIHKLLKTEINCINHSAVTKKTKSYNFLHKLSNLIYFMELMKFHNFHHSIRKKIYWFRTIYIINSFQAFNVTYYSCITAKENVYFNLSKYLISK